MSEIKNEKLEKLSEIKFMTKKGFSQEKIFLNCLRFLKNDKSIQFKNLLKQYDNYVEYFHSNILYHLFLFYKSENKKDNFINDLCNYFDKVFLLDREEYINNFSLKELLELKAKINDFYVWDKNKDKIRYRFVWDLVGYSFGPIQLNLTSNYGMASKVLLDIGFTKEEIKKLQNPPTTNNKKINEQYTENNGLNQKLYNRKKEVYDYSANILFDRYKNIKNREYVRFFKYETINTFLELLDFDVQFRFSDVAKGNSLKQYMIKLRNKGVKVFTDKLFMEYKLSTKFCQTSTGVLITKTRMKNINSFKISDKKNLDINQIEEIVDRDIIMTIISRNELSIQNNSSNLQRIVEHFKTDEKINFSKVAEIKFTEEEVNKETNSEEKEEIKYDETNKDGHETNSKTEEMLFNELKGIIFENNSPIDCYRFDDKISTLQKMYRLFLESKDKTYLKDIIKKADKELALLIVETKNFTLNFSYAYSVLKNIVREVDIKSGSPNYVIVVGATKNILNIFKDLIENDFLTSYREINGIFKNSYNELKFSLNSNFYADNFLNNLTGFAKDYYNQVKTNNPFSIFLDKAKMFKLKELDYRNMEATFRKTPPMINKVNCDKIYVLIYIVLCFAIKKNKFYKSYSEDIEAEKSIDKIADLFKKIKNTNWKNKYSETEKQFSLLFNFIERRNNQFTNVMKDKGFDESQKDMFKIRKELNKAKDDLIDKINEIFYGTQGKGGIYDVFQGLADITFELSKPMNLYTDLKLKSDGLNLFDSIFNACVDSVEMQTCMLIYDLIFNFEIPIGKKKYSLNDLNNMIKIMNLIITTSENPNMNISISTKNKLAKSTSEYYYLEKIGFLTYKREIDWFKTEIEELNIKEKEDITGYYAEDEKLLIGALEYCRKKPNECSMGDYVELRKRFLSLTNIEWIAIYANYKLENEDSLYANGIPTYIKPSVYLKIIDVTYLNIRTFVEELEKEILNLKPEVSYVNNYLLQLYFDVNKKPEKIEDFISETKEAFYRYYNNVIINERNLIDKISNKISDNKIYDWMMKMMPTYSLLADIFGLKHISIFNTLDTFLNNLIDKLNVIIKIIFDQYKREIIDRTETRKYQMLNEEYYYYVQSFPLMIDWVIYNLETFLNQCSSGGINDVLDKDAILENSENLEYVFNSYLIKIKEILKILSQKQLNDFRHELSSELSKTSISQEKINHLVESIVDFSKVYDVNLKLDNKEISEICELLHFELENRFSKYF